jgi:hypothetical protein
MNKLVQIELNQQTESDFFTSKYRLYKNNEYVLTVTINKKQLNIYL